LQAGNVGTVERKHVEAHMNQGGGLEGVVGGLTGRARGGDPAQLVLDEREQVGGGPAVTGGGSVEEASHIGHPDECNRCGRHDRGKAAAERSSIPSPDVYSCRDEGRWENGRPAIGD
jgi:hypothetical protein